MVLVLRLVLILVLMLTGIGLGAARGIVQSGGQVVLCTGQGIVVRHLPGESGQNQAHICPDMALALLNATPPAAPVILPPDLSRRAVLTIPSQSGYSVAPPTASARDPPAVMFAV